MEKERLPNAIYRVNTPTLLVGQEPKGSWGRRASSLKTREVLGMVRHVVTLELVPPEAHAPGPALNTQGEANSTDVAHL